MKDIRLNNLNINQRRILQIGVVVLLLVFLSFYFFLKRESNSVTGNNEVYLEDTKLQIFDDTHTFTGYPNRILVHYPYFIYIQGNKPLSTVYNLETREKVKEIQDVILDYYDGNIVYNRKETFYNDKNLGEFCDTAFIKSSSEILCITKQSQNYADNRLISINPETPNLWKRLYQSDNILTTVSVINGDLYIGEINLETKQNYLTINEDTITVDTPVNMIYEMGRNPYFASLKGELSKSEIYYKINGAEISKVSREKILIYR